MATIHDVASACGVSISTVSRAISRPDLVNAATRERVLAAVAELGYQLSTAVLCTLLQALTVGHPLRSSTTMERIAAVL